jgi:hypothetical protein
VVAEEAAAKGWNMNADELAVYEEHLTEAKNCLECIKRDKSDAAFMEQVKDIFGPGELVGPNGPFPRSGAGPHDKTRRLTFAGMAGTLARGIRPDGPGQKALSPSGAAVVGQEFKPDPVALGQPALSLLDVIPVIQHATPELSYLS